MYYNRSRLQRLEEKRNLRKASLYIAGTVLLIVAAIAVGLPLLTKLVILVMDFKSANKPVTRTDIIPPVPPIIDVAYSATNSATINVSGRSEPGSTVVLSLNNQEVGTLVTNDNGEFIFTHQIDLQVGENTLIAVASDQAGNVSKTSYETIIFYFNKAPEIKIETPVDRQAVNGKEVEIKGELSAPAKLTINDRTVIVDSQRKFVTKYALNPGDNVLVFNATDMAGNKTRKELTVTSLQ